MKFNCYKLYSLNCSKNSRCDRGSVNAGVVHYMNINRPDIENRVTYRNADVVGRLRRLSIILWVYCLHGFKKQFE